MTGVEANVQIRRGQRQAFLRRVGCRAARAPGTAPRASSRCATSAGGSSTAACGSASRRTCGPAAARSSSRAPTSTCPRATSPRSSSTSTTCSGARAARSARPTCAGSWRGSRDLGRYDGVSARRPPQAPGRRLQPGQPSYRGPGPAHLRQRPRRTSASPAERRSALVEPVHDAGRRERRGVDPRQRRRQQAPRTRPCSPRSARAAARPASPRPDAVRVVGRVADERERQLRLAGQHGLRARGLRDGGDARRPRARGSRPSC